MCAELGHVKPGGDGPWSGEEKVGPEELLRKKRSHTAVVWAQATLTLEQSRAGLELGVVGSGQHDRILKIGL